MEMHKSKIAALRTPCLLSNICDTRAESHIYESNGSHCYSSVEADPWTYMRLSGVAYAAGFLVVVNFKVSYQLFLILPFTNVYADPLFCLPACLMKDKAKVPVINASQRPRTTQNSVG